MNTCNLYYTHSIIMFVTFTKIAGARTGNILFQYLFCIRISILYGHKYIAIEDLDINELAKNNVVFKLTDDNALDFDYQTNAASSHILCEGFFQNASFYLPIREKILEYLKTTDDSWIGFSGKREFIRDFLTSQHPVQLKQNDIVMALRLDDFIQLPNPTSDILPPQYYMDILEKWFSTEGRSDGNLIIVSDYLCHYWEHKYIEYFQKWSPIMVSNTLSEDFALMRDCNALIHSNSTLCWFASFLSEKKTHRFIPVTGFYSSQYLEAICSETDNVVRVRPMEHKDIYAMNVMCWHRDIGTIPYCIPSSVFPENLIPIQDKKYVISPLIPGDTSNYLFHAGEEAKYYDMYRKSMFAHTKKKGGWDCLRHYEILAAGCIPFFDDLDKCPLDTLVSFPKDILRDAYKVLLPWRNTEDQRVLYPLYLERLWTHTKQHCSTIVNAERFLRDMTHIGTCPKNILLLVGHSGVNYTRELNWIGIKQWAESVGSNAVEYPALDFLYDDFPEERLSELYGNGFTYSKRLSSSLRSTITETELVESIQQKKWDMIIYGKVGPDETDIGSVPNLPFWQHVFKRYSRDEIVFWYGGDGMQDMTYANRYSDHLARHCQYARCFVRELIRWDGTFE
jgi:hypothetical protein